MKNILIKFNKNIYFQQEICYNAVKQTKYFRNLGSGAMQLKRYEAAAILVFIIFASFTLGYYVGRDSVDAAIVISAQNSVVQALNEVSTVISADETTAAGMTDDSESSEHVSAAATSEFEPDNASDTVLININTASAEELKELPGIGDVLAQRIIDYRSTHGPFSSKIDITNVSGIGEKTYEKICDLISV